MWKDVSIRPSPYSTQYSFSVELDSGEIFEGAYHKLCSMHKSRVEEWYDSSDRDAVKLCVSKWFDHTEE